MRSVTISLADASYTIHELKARPNAAWRQKMQAILTEITNLLHTAPGLDLTRESIAELLQAGQRLVLDSPDRVRDLLFAYAPELAAERERLELEAYDSEFMAAFTEVLTLAYPFGRLGKILTGALSKATLPSSPAASGVSGTTK